MKEALPGLSWDGALWEGRVRIPLFGVEHNVPLLIRGSADRPISQHQRLTLDRFLDSATELGPRIESALYEYYGQIAQEQRDMREPEVAALEVPHVQSKREIGRLVTPTTVHISELDTGGKRVIGLLFDCTWDLDNGVGVRLVDENVDEVGPQQIVL